jgi:hypothetical protein
LIGSVLPVGAAIGNTNLNFPVVDGFSQGIITFTGGHYTYYSYDGGWVDQNDVPTATPSLNVGQGFFYINNGTATNWTQTLGNN